MNDDAFLYREEHGDIEEPDSLPLVNIADPMTDELKPCCDYTTDIRCIFYESDEFGTRCRMHMGVQNPNCDDGVAKTIVIHGWVRE